jgi:Tol biopolymer transport system component
MLATLLAGTIAFVSHQPAGIEVVAPDGSGRRALVAGEGRYHPAWSPGGERLAYTAGAGELRIVTADGTGDTPLDLGGLIPSRPAWSPDGTRIAFAGHRGGQVDLYVVHLDSARVERLTDDPELDAAPAWSPDGSRLAYTRRVGYYAELWTLGPGGPAPLVTGAETATPDWSPDGARIAFAQGGDVFAVPAGGGAPARIVAEASEPAWSPDGTELAFSRRGVHVLELATGATRTLAGGDASDPAWSRPAAAVPPPAPEAPPPAPAPQEPPRAPLHPGLIAFVRNDEIFTMNPGGGEVRRVTRGIDPSWGPDGRLVFSRSGSLYVIERGRVRRLTSGAIDRHPAWSPSGTLIAFTRTTGGRSAEIWLTRPDGGGARRLTPPGAAIYREPAWSADGARLAIERMDFSLRPPAGSNEEELLREGYGMPSYGLGLCTLRMDGAGALLCRDSGGLERTPAWHPRTGRLLYIANQRTFSTTIFGYVPGDHSAQLVHGRGLYRDIFRRYDEREAACSGAQQDLAVAPDGRTIAVVARDDDGHDRIYVVRGQRCDPITDARGSYQPSWQALPAPLPGRRSGRLGKRPRVTATRRGARVRVVNRNRFWVTVRIGRIERRVAPRTTRTLPARGRRVRVRAPLGSWTNLRVDR